ncbi:MAG TPA: helix-turn-helix transcriptional regulator [Caulobacteraceae bacterium]|nr:helix-turn-helix transcriptional regulator [Caulobacteraceae bacterium]
MASAIFTEDYEVLVALLIRARREAGVSQRGLAARIGRSQSHVNMIEKRQRRIEVREFYLLCKALGADPAAVFQCFADEMEARQAA